MSDSEDELQTRHRPGGFGRRARRKKIACSDESDEADDPDDDPNDDDTDGVKDDPEDAAFLTDGFDKQRFENARAVCEIAEVNARNLQWPFDLDNPDEECEGQHVHSVAHSFVNDLRFLVPTSTSTKWNSAFVRVLRHSHSMQVTCASELQKELIRKTGGLCQVCGTREHSCPWVVHLCGNRRRETYNARQWERVEDWPRLFDKFLPGYEDVTSPGWRPPPRAVPEEYLGAYAVGKDCYRKLVLAFVGQNLIMELIYGAWVHIANLDSDPGYRHAPSVTDQRISMLLKTLDDLKACAASDYPRIPQVPYERTYWNAIDTHIAKLSHNDPLKALEIGGIRAREILDLVEEEPEASEESGGEENDDNADGLDEEASEPAGRRGKRKANEGHSHYTRSRRQAAGAASPVYRSNGAPKSATVKPKKPVVCIPRRKAAAVGDELRRKQLKEQKQRERQDEESELSDAAESDNEREEMEDELVREAILQSQQSQEDESIQEAIRQSREEEAVQEAIRQSRGRSSEGAGSSRDALPAPPPVPVADQPQQQQPRGAPHVATASQGAGRLRAMQSDATDPASRVLRGYETTISEAMSLATYLHQSGASEWSAVASRIVVTLQDLVEKNRNLRAR